MAYLGRATQQLREAQKTNQAKQPAKMVAKLGHKVMYNKT